MSHQIGGSMPLSDYRRKHSFSIGWTNQQIQLGRLRVFRVGTYRFVAQEAEQDHLISLGWEVDQPQAA